MDLSGDRLAVFLFLAGGVVAAFLAALPLARRARGPFWAVGVFFAIATALWAYLPIIGAPALRAAIGSFVTQFLRSGAPLMISTIGIVSLMLRGASVRQSLGPDPNVAISFNNDPPAFANPGRLSKWTPNISLEEAMVYLGTESQWSSLYTNGPTVSDTIGELTRGLSYNKVVSWGKEHPDDPRYYEIYSPFWISSDVKIDRNYVFFRSVKVAVYDVKLSRGELESAWPPAQPSV